MKLDRLNNSKRNMIHGILFKLLDTILPFINRTVLLKVLGIDYLGLNSLFISILSVLSLAELGFGTAITFCMFKPISEDDTETVNALLFFYKKIYRRIGIVILAVGLCFCPFVEKFISGDAPPDVNIHLIFLIQLFNTVISYFFFGYKSSILSAYQREDTISKVTSWTLVLQYLIQLVLLFLTRNYYIYLIVVPFVTLLRDAIKYVLATRMFPMHNTKNRYKLDNQNIMHISRRVKALFMHKIGGVITNSFDSVVISAFLGLPLNAIYNNYWYILSSVGNTIAIFYSSILAGIGNSIAIENENENYEKFKKLTIINYWIVGWCTVCLLCLYQPFMKLWVGEKLLLPFHTSVLFTVCFYVNLVRRMNVTFKDAGGIWVEDRYKPLISGVLNLILNVFLINIIGIDGVIISTIISFAFVEVPWEVYVLFKYYFKKQKKEYYANLIKSTIIIVFVSFITYLIVYYFSLKFINNNILFLFIDLIICIIVPNFLLYLFWRKKINFIWKYLFKNTH